MAINLTVALNDAEQAHVVQVASVVSPGMTAPQLKAWAEQFCKEALRDKVKELAMEAAVNAEREAANAARRATEAEVAAAWGG
jgi:Na+-transporting NADH:ubiquinone oxidoreductase subunit NqrC